MVDQEVFNWLVGVTTTILGWFGKTLWDAVGELKRDIREIEVDLPSNYVRKDYLEARLDKVEAMLSKIYDRIDTKADK